MTMNAELKAKWITALRSGEFKQVRGAIEWRGDLCCLGVLCKINGQMPHHSTAEKLIYGEAYGVLLPNGVEPLDPFVHRNDGQGAFKDRPQTFSEIADWLESQP